MQNDTQTVGIVGGTGALGSAIAQALIETRTVTPDRLWVSNRSGSLGRLAKWPEIRSTDDANVLAGACDTVILSVPPDQARALSVAAGTRLVISVMAGVTIDQLAAMTGSPRVVRAMSSPAAAMQLAYTPWLPRGTISDDDAATVTRLFSACGVAERVTSEDQIDHFTAMTGPVPGFVAAFADAMIAHATRQGIPPETATRAIRQLFLASGTMMALDVEKSPADHVREMLDYAGTTAAGLAELRNAGLDQVVSRGLEAAYRKAKTIGG